MGLELQAFRPHLRGRTSYNRIKHSCRRELGLDLLLRTTMKVEAKEGGERLGRRGKKRS